MNKLRKIWSVLSASERYAVSTAAAIFIFAFVLNNILMAWERSIDAPLAGGNYKEGIIGQPTFINPVISGTNDADRDLIRLIFSNVIDLSESANASENGRIWTVRLKENLFWHDGEPLTSDDIIFTINSIQDPDSNSPLFRTWQGVVAERVSSRELRLVTRTPYAFFENNLRELFIIPKHIFADVPPANFKLSDYNLKPLGSGPFQFVNFETRRDGFITHLALKRNEEYIGEMPLIENLILKFYSDEDRIINALNNRQIDGFGGIDPMNLNKIKIRHDLREISMPRYYAVFFNADSNPALNDKNVRLALRQATDKSVLVNNVLDGHGKVSHGPLLADMEGFGKDIYTETEFSIEKAAAILEAGGWLPDEEDEGIRARELKQGIVKLNFVIVVPQIDFLVKTAQILKDDWLKIGARLNVVMLDPRGIVSERIRARDYEMLMFGNILNSVPDLFSFWHSSEKYYPGLNLSLYDSRTADALLESIREDADPERRAGDLNALQSVIYNDAPAIFLYSPDYLYVSVPFLGGFDDSFITTPSHRFDRVEQWHTKSVRLLQF